MLIWLVFHNCFPKTKYYISLHVTWKKYFNNNIYRFCMHHFSSQFVWIKRTHFVFYFAMSTEEKRARQSASSWPQFLKLPLFNSGFRQFIQMIILTSNKQATVAWKHSITSLLLFIIITIFPLMYSFRHAHLQYPFLPETEINTDLHMSTTQ